MNCIVFKNGVRLYLVVLYDAMFGCFVLMKQMAFNAWYNNLTQYLGFADDQKNTSLTWTLIKTNRFVVLYVT